MLLSIPVVLYKEAENQLQFKISSVIDKNQQCHRQKQYISDTRNTDHDIHHKLYEFNLSSSLTRVEFGERLANKVLGTLR